MEREGDIFSLCCTNTADTHACMYGVTSEWQGCHMVGRPGAVRGSVPGGELATSSYQPTLYTDWLVHAGLETADYQLWLPTTSYNLQACSETAFTLTAFLLVIALPRLCFVWLSVFVNKGYPSTICRVWIKVDWLISGSEYVLPSVCNEPSQYNWLLNCKISCLHLTSFEG